MESGATTVPQVNIDDVRQAIEDGSAQVVDVRPSFDFAGGRIPGSLSFPGTSIVTRSEQLDKQMRTIFLSEDGTQSDVAIQAALGNGFSDVANLAGGFDAWLDADYPIHTIDDGA